MSLQLRESCNDRNCPFHGKLPTRGRVLEGTIVSDKMDKTVIVRSDYLGFVPKYKRYERKHGKFSAHCPPCLNAKEGDRVKISECRPISKTVSFVVIEILEAIKGGSQS